MVICVFLASAALLWPGSGPRAPVGGRFGGRVLDGWGIGGAGIGGAGSGAWGIGGRGRTALHTGAARRGEGPRGWAALSVVAVATALGVVAAFAGPAVFLAVGGLTATGFRLVRRALLDRRRRSALADILAGLRLLVRELRAGAEPTIAARNAGSAARRDGVVVLRGLAELAVTDGRAQVPDADSASGSLVDADPVVQVSARLRSGWLLSRRHGVALTPLIDALAEDLAEQISAAAERAGEVAGPRMSGYVMALLPLLGIALGAGMGANPLRVLVSSPLGNVLLLAGVALTCAGLLWSERIVRR